MSLSHRIGNGRTSLRERGDDLYETPREAVEALAGVENLPHRIWEPACGPGAIVTALRARGHFAEASDLVDYGCPDSQAHIDFLMERRRPDVGAIVTNPPYKLAGEFVAHALAIGVPMVCMLLRLQFLEGLGRTEILESGRLARVHVFRDRLPMMHRHGWEGPKASSGTAFAWFVWSHSHRGAPTLHRLTCRRKLSLNGGHVDLGRSRV